MFAFERAAQPGVLGREPLKNWVIAANDGPRAPVCRANLHVSALEPA
jgi:hypothetical protein